MLVQLKQAVSAMHPSLPRENPGSKWPKTSLGAVKDRKRLTPAQLEKLIAICKCGPAHTGLEIQLLHMIDSGKAEHPGHGDSN